MRRVVVTGLGVVSCLGNDVASVWRSLREVASGLRIVPEMKELGYKEPVAGMVSGLDTGKIAKRWLQTMPDAAQYAAVATLEALEAARLPQETLRSRRAGAVVGSSVGGSEMVSETELRAHRNPARVGATPVVRSMNATAALNLAAWLGLKGRCYSLSSACSSGPDSIGHGFELIRAGILDVCITGATEGRGSRSGWAFGAASGPVAPELEAHPELACRPYDVDRRGPVPAEGGAIVVLEAMEFAERRGAPVVAEVIGYGSADDGESMFRPTGIGLRRAIEQALSCARELGEVEIDYINTHGPGTELGDPVEIEVIRQVFGEPSPFVSSTKALTGHSQGAAGAHEAVFTLLMLRHDHLVPTANLERVADDCAGVRHVRSPLPMKLRTVMTLSMGLGGTNACLVFRKP